MIFTIERLIEFDKKELSDRHMFFSKKNTMFWFKAISCFVLLSASAVFGFLGASYYNNIVFPIIAIFLMVIIVLVYKQLIVQAYSDLRKIGRKYNINIPRDATNFDITELRIKKLEDFLKENGVYKKELLVFLLEALRYRNTIPKFKYNTGSFLQFLIGLALGALLNSFFTLNVVDTTSLNSATNLMVYILIIATMVYIYAAKIVFEGLHQIKINSEYRLIAILENIILNYTEEIV